MRIVKCDVCGNIVTARARFKRVMIVEKEQEEIANGWDKEFNFPLEFDVCMDCYNALKSGAEEIKVTYEKNRRDPVIDDLR